MRLPLRDLGLAVATALALVGFDEARDSITAGEIQGHLFLLASDALEGRAPGTRGADLAAEYIQSRFIALGLQPVHGSYVQDVPVEGVTVAPESIHLGFEHGDDRTAAAYSTEAVVWPGQTPAIDLAGELVFVGYGIEAPEWRWDDFGDADLSGKVLLFLIGDPPAPPDEPGLFDGRALTYYGRWTHKLEEARRRGAAGALIVHRPDAAGYDWDVVVSSWTGERLMLQQDDGDGAPTPLQGWISGALAARTLRLAGLDLDQLAVEAARRDFRPVETGITVRSRLESRTRRVRTRNVVGYLPGSDPARSQEVVVFTSHYDHLGLGAPVDGDSIYNGAYDNASGVALLLEIAGAFARVDRPARSVLFIATTGEEAGQLGARHYVRRPLFPLHHTAAAFNIDGANLWGETHDVIGLGAELSTLGDGLRQRAAEMGIQVRPDPVPERGAFFRSDQFPFARAGVPVLNIQHGLRFRDRPQGWGDELMERWLARHYHRPSDAYAPSVDLSGAVQQGRLIFAAGYDVAVAAAMPQWLPDVPYGAARDRSPP